METFNGLFFGLLLCAIIFYPWTIVATLLAFAYAKKFHSGVLIILFGLVINYLWLGMESKSLDPREWDGLILALWPVSLLASLVLCVALHWCENAYKTRVRTKLSRGTDSANPVGRLASLNVPHH